MKLGIDFGGSHIGIGIVENATIIRKKDINIQVKNISEVLEKYIPILIDELKIVWNDIDLIGLGIPGDVKNGVSYNLVNLGENEINIKEEIRKVIPQSKNIKLICRNDGKCAGLAEKQYGSLKNYKDAIFLCLGTGIGSAVFMNNKLLIPKRHTGFELGHIIIEKNGISCNCGSKGCLERYASMKCFKDEVKRCLNTQLDGKELLNIVLKNENRVEKIIDSYIDNLSIGISNIINIFEPEAISIGGSFKYYKDILYNRLLHKMYKKEYVFNKTDIPDILLAELGNDAGIIGATIE